LSLWCVQIKDETRQCLMQSPNCSCCVD